MLEKVLIMKSVCVSSGRVKKSNSIVLALKTGGERVSYCHTLYKLKSTETNVTFVILGYINKH